MRSIPFEVEEETYEEQSRAGRYNPGLVLLYRDKRKIQRVPIGAGTSDDIYVYREGDDIYVLTVNDRLGYVGLDIFSGDPAEKAGEMFLQTDYEIEEILGRRGLDLSPPTMIRYMSNYIY